MGLLRWLLSLFGGASRSSKRSSERTSRRVSKRRRKRRASLVPFRADRVAGPRRAPSVFEKSPPYPFARREPTTGRFVDLAGGMDRERLESFGLPIASAPEHLVELFDLTLPRIAWLTLRFVPGGRPPSTKQAHYVFHWKPKRSGGFRLIESPKPLLRDVQTRILREILDRVPPHPAAHGFTKGRSIRSNAVPHCGQAVVVKWDLENFYANVRFNRVVAIFRSLGYSREAAIWFASLTTSAIPADLAFPESGAHAIEPYLGRHLPQGAPTSPALANLSAYSLDVRLSGLAKSFGGVYTRYADDITISGDETFATGLRTFIPLVQQVIRQERFCVHPKKRKIVRRCRRQTVAGVVVNSRPNVRRDEYDRLKAILHNAKRTGLQSQNRDGHPDFAAHLRGRIAHVAMLNPQRGEKLLAIFETIGT